VNSKGWNDFVWQLVEQLKSHFFFFSSDKNHLFEFGFLNLFHKLPVTLISAYQADALNLFQPFKLLGIFRQILSMAVRIKKTNCPIFLPTFTFPAPPTSSSTTTLFFSLQSAARSTQTLALRFPFSLLFRFSSLVFHFFRQVRNRSEESLESSSANKKEQKKSSKRNHVLLHWLLVV
jgi:hypothetical protein